MTTSDKYLSLLIKHEQMIQKKLESIDRKYRRMMNRAFTPEMVLSANAWHRDQVAALKKEQAEGWLELAKKYQDEEEGK